MDVQRLRRAAGSGASSLVDLPEYIITTFFPGARPLLDTHPQLFRFLGFFLAVWYFGPLARLQSVWNRVSSLIVATVTVSSEEDLFAYLTSYIAERKTLRADTTLNATSNSPQETRRRHRHDPDFEDGGRRTTEDPKIRYEQGQGMQLFVYKKRLFYITRKYGEGHTYFGNRYKRIEIMNVSCLGRSTEPVKDLIEHVYYLNKDKERSLTIIRRPYSGGYGSRLNWSRLTSKPRRALDTVILDAGQKEKVIADVEEYLAESTMNFYANHGIPYRRGYLFHGPPGVGKTSFALALASRFSLDVYNMTLLDHDLTDSDMISLLNQLPGRSLLLLEDIDTAGLNRKGKPTTRRRAGRHGRFMPEGAIANSTSAETGDLDSDDDGTTSQSRVTLSGLLNAIDGVGAPESHVLILTSNRPHDLDDALVRAGRISVRVEFKNASKAQAEEIFLRMYVTMPSTGGSDSLDKPAKEVVQPDTQEKTTAQLHALAKEFAALIPDYDFSPADLQDYLLIHKKDPAKAVAELPRWMEETYRDRKAKEEEKEAELALKRKTVEEKRQKFVEVVKAAVKEADEEGSGSDRGKGRSKAEDSLHGTDMAGSSNADQEKTKKDGEATNESQD
ncbi:putative mitochondrial chaperone BCS1-B [Exophiala dermatitidis]